jgi:MFS superfamily sulfate permease-like transporter
VIVPAGYQQVSKNSNFNGRFHNSAPVLTGFKAGIAIVIVVGQIPKLLGVHFDTAGFLQNVMNIVRHVPDTSPATVVLGVALLGLIVGLERFLPQASESVRPSRCQ